MSAKATGFILLAVCLIIIYIANAPDQKSRPPKTVVETVAAKDVAPVAPLPPPKPKSRWINKREVSPIDDSLDIFALIKANEQNGPIIAIQCHEKNKNTYLSIIYENIVASAGFAHGNSITYLIWRFDGGKAQESRWIKNDDGKSVSPLGGGQGSG